MNESFPKKTESTQEKIGSELVEMMRVDQKMIKSPQWLEVGQRHKARLKEIIATFGWPTISKVGEVASTAAWLLVQHADADPTFQQECLDLIKALPEGEVSKSNIAYLEDRVRVHMSKPMLYGTQFYKDTEGKFGPRPIEEFERLDERRAEVGLGTFEEYKKLMEERHQHDIETTENSEKAPGIVIEKASGEDVEAINRVYYEAWLATYPNEQAGITVDDIEDSYKDSFTPETIEKTKRAYENVSPNEYRIAAKIDGKVVGISRVIKQEDRNKLQTLYVLPEYQGKGVGSALWEVGKEFLDPKKDTYLEVVDYNQNAINFYKKLGFEDTGKRMTDERFRMKSGSIFTEMEMRRPADLPIKADI